MREHKFRHNFNDTIDPFCLCGTNDIETSEHFLLRCPNYAYLRLKLFDNLRNNNMLLLPLESRLNCSDSFIWFRKLRKFQGTYEIQNGDPKVINFCGINSAQFFIFFQISETNSLPLIFAPPYFRCQIRSL